MVSPTQTAATARAAVPRSPSARTPAVIEFTRAKGRLESRRIIDEAGRLMAHRKYAEAETLLRQALELEPQDIVFRNMLIRACGRQGKLAEARQTYDSMIQEGSADTYTFNAMLDAYARSGRIRQAGGVFETACSWGLDDSVTHKTFADVFYNKGHFEEALAVLRAAPPEHRKAEDIRLMELELLRKMARYDEALGLVEELLSDSGLSGHRKRQARVARAYCFKELGRLDEAASEFRALEKELPQGSIHMPRVLAGRVLIGDVLYDEGPAMRERLERLERETNGRHINGHVGKALKILDQFERPY